MASVFQLLDQEWARLSTNRASARRLHTICALAGVTSLAELEHHVRRCAPVDADRVLLALVERVINHGDDLAARVLLQLLLPGTRNLARRWWALGDPDERAAAAVSAVYGRIRNYPLARRPGRIAANVLLDAARDLRRAVPRVLATPTADLAGQRGDHHYEGSPAGPAEELAEVLAAAVADGVIARADAQLIAQSRIAGHRIADIAAGHRLGTRALWDRRQRAEARLAAMQVA